VEACRTDCALQLEYSKIDVPTKSAEVISEVYDVLAHRPTVQALLAAVIRLQSLDIALWWGSYEERVAIDPEPGPFFPVTAKAISKVAIVFATMGERPKLIVDLSHTVGLGPTFEDQE